MRAKLFSIALAAVAISAFINVHQADAQAQAVGNNIVPLPSQNPMLAQTHYVDEGARTPPPADSSAMELDLAPVKLPERSSPLANFDSMKTNMLYKLPARMFWLCSQQKNQSVIELFLLT